MTYSVATHFDQPTWDRFGVNWLRKAKSEKLTGFIVGMNLSDEAKIKILDFGFVYYPMVLNRLQIPDLCNHCCLLTNFDEIPKAGLPEDADVVCSIDKSISALDIVSPIVNLPNRAKAVRLIQEKVEKIHGGILSTKYILGSVDFWAGFSGFQTYIRNQTYLEDNFILDDLLFNLYLSFFKLNLKII